MNCGAQSLDLRSSVSPMTYRERLIYEEQMASAWRLVDELGDISARLSRAADAALKALEDRADAGTER